MVIAVNSRNLKKTLTGRRISGSGFFSNLWSNVKKFFKSDTAKKILRKGVSVATTEGKKYLPQLGDKLWHGIQKGVLKRKEDQITALPDVVKKGITKGIDLGSSELMKKIDPGPKVDPALKDSDVKESQGSGMKSRLTKERRKALDSLLKGGGIRSVRK